MTLELAMLVWQLLSAGSVRGVQTTVTDQGAGPVQVRTVLLPREDFNEQTIVAVCREFMRQTGGRLAKLVLITAERDAHYLSKAVHTTYESWYPDYEDKLRHSGPFAELIVMGSEGTLRIRYGSAEATRVVLGTRDPLIMNVGDQDFQLLDFHFTQLRQPIPEIAPAGWLVEFYFSTRHTLTLSAAERLTGAVLRNAGVGQATVSLRNDVWFIDDPGFPTYFRFSPQPAPTLAEYKSGAQASCSVMQHSRIVCRGRNLPSENAPH